MERLTRREEEVAALLLQGRSNKEIAAELGITVSVVKKHVGSLLRKTGTESRLQLALRLRDPPSGTKGP